MAFSGKEKDVIKSALFSLGVSYKLKSAEREDERRRAVATWPILSTVGEYPDTDDLTFINGCEKMVSEIDKIIAKVEDEL